MQVNVDEESDRKSEEEMNANAGTVEEVRLQQSEEAEPSQSVSQAASRPTCESNAAEAEAAQAIPPQTLCAIDATCTAIAYSLIEGTLRTVRHELATLSDITSFPWPVFESYSPLS